MGATKQGEILRDTRAEISQKQVLSSQWNFPRQKSTIISIHCQSSDHCFFDFDGVVNFQILFQGQTVNRVKVFWKYYEKKFAKRERSWARKLVALSIVA